jgi:hypothetical protein
MNSIYCSPTHLKVLAGSGDARHVRVNNHVSIPLPDVGILNGIITDTDAMTEYFRNLANELGLVGSASWLVVNNSNIQTKVMDIPRVGEDKALAFISRELGQYGKSDADEVYDFAVLNQRAPSGGMTVLAVGVAREFLSQWKKVLVSSGVSLRGIDLGLHCQLRLAHVLPQLREGKVIFAFVDGRALSMTLFRDGIYQVQNRSRMMHPFGDPGWAGEIGRAVSSMMQFNRTQGTDEISTVYFAGVTEDGLADMQSRLSGLGIVGKKLAMKEIVTLTGKASEDATLDLGAYSLNIGNLIGRK